MEHISKNNPLKNIQSCDEIEEKILEKYKPLKFLRSNTQDFSVGDTTLEQFILDFHRTNGNFSSDSAGSLPNRQVYGSSRSLIDIFLLAKNYYPDCIFKEVKDIIFKSNWASIICPHISRRVYPQDQTVYRAYLINSEIAKKNETPDEFGLTLQQLKNL